MGNGPTEDEAGIMDHDQLSQHSEEGDEVSPWNVTSLEHTFCPFPGQHFDKYTVVE